MATEKMTVWRLKAGADRRFKAGHPWVYSNELEGSPKGIEPGDPIELRDATGKFLARGYGNPSSLIAFRSLSRVPSDEHPSSPKAVTEKLLQAHRAREIVGLSRYSHRLCFGEADGLPGLVVDRYLTAGDAQVFVIQAHTAGADRMLAFLPESLKTLAEKTGGPSWEKTAIVIRNDLGIRKLEGVAEEEVRIAKENGADLSQSLIRVRAATEDRAVEFACDLLEGQKTGFFLDQGGNIQLAALRLRGLRPRRILDLCSYVGQWSAQLAKLAGGESVEVTCVDSSAKALEFARRNVEAAASGVKFTPLKGDVLRDLESLPEKSFDLVVCDPPALIKGRKDIPVGKQAYLKLNTQAFRLLAPGGAIVTCSCSGLLEEEEFAAAISKAAYRNGVRVRYVGRGGQAPDHPFVPEFPEGRYLKCWVGIAEK